ncbi:MAG: aspartate 1-decarboxylase [Deltaproteobacteria bacterium]|nr:aspartate 1-decarboxylase [Deltaproteobacteria bacterium]
MRKMMRGKIHRATVTGADLHYEGSVTIDSDLLRAAGIINNEAVCIWNINNGERFETYALEGEAGSGVICVNGAAAHKVAVGHLVIIAAFGWMTDDEALAWKPSVAFVDDKNRLVELDRDHEVAGQSHLKKVWG